MVIEEASNVDLEEILSIQKIAYRSEAEIYNNYDIQPLTQTKDEIKEEFGDHLFLKAMVGARMAGSVRAKQIDAICYIGKLIVHPDFQSRGVGRSLMTSIEEKFCAAGCYEVFTGHKSDRNLGIYRRLGYVESHSKIITPNLSLVYLQKQAGKCA